MKWRVRLIDNWRRLHHFASFWAAIIAGVLYAGIPALADQWPNLLPAITALFPNGGQQWGPVIGAALFVVARVLQFERRSSDDHP